MLSDCRYAILSLTRTLIMQYISTSYGRRHNNNNNNHHHHHHVGTARNFRTTSIFLCNYSRAWLKLVPIIVKYCHN
jgi:hypothetical protein